MLRNKSGMALLITLAAISFLVALTVQLATRVNWQMQAAGNQKDAVQLDAALSSVLSLFRATLLVDQKANPDKKTTKKKFDSLFDQWNTLDGKKLAALVGADTVSLQVVDLSGRIQLNRLVLTQEEKKEQQQQEREQGRQGAKARDPEKMQRALVKRFLLSGKFAVADEDEAETLLDALTDWLDEDNEERDHGAENGYYQGLEPHYVCRNGPLQYPEELLLVKGFSRKLLYGDKKHQGIAPYLSVSGRDGKINLNTAPLPVLQSLAEGMSEEMAQQLLAFRGDPDNLELLEKPGWYRQVADFPGDVMGRMDKNSALLTTKSAYFSCRITVGRAGMHRDGIAVLYRDPATFQQTLVRWKVE